MNDFLIFAFQILWQLYDQEIIQEEAILKWDAEKKEADDSDKLFVKQAEKFIEVRNLLFSIICFVSQIDRVTCIYLWFSG